MEESKLLDLRDCTESYKKIFNEMLELTLLKNPRWFRYLLKKVKFIQNLIGYDSWSRAWEYPWAIHAANLENRLRVVDVGGGGSPFADYLAKYGHDSYVIDPSLRDGINLEFDKNKSIFKNFRSLIYHFILNTLKISTSEGIHSNKNPMVKYSSSKAQSINFPDNYFDRVFCLSVIEHIPQKHWEKCIQEFSRILKPKGRLIITMDMGISQANQQLYLKLVNYCTLSLVGNPSYDIPISEEDKEKRHPGNSYETIGLVWKA